MQSVALRCAASAAFGIALAAASPATALVQTFYGQDSLPLPRFGEADAARVAFSDLLDPLAAAINVNNFESFEPGTTGLLAFDYINSSSSEFRSELQGGANTVLGAEAGSRFALSGTRFLSIDNGFVVNFAEGVRAIGFDLTGLGGTLSLVLDSVAETISVPPSGSIAGDLAFFGLVSDDPFTSVTFNVTGGFGLDDLRVAAASQVVPVPAALPLLASGVALMGWLRLRRSASAT